MSAKVPDWRIPCAAWAVAVLSMLAMPEQAIAAAPVAACTERPVTGYVTLRVNAGGRQREVRLLLPPAYDGERKLPLVFDLHGSGGNGAAQESNSGLASVAGTQGFVAAWPDGGVVLPGEAGAHYWNIPGTMLTGDRPIPADAPDEIVFFRAAIDTLVADYCVDPRRVYVAGFSGGARMASMLACGLADRIAAIAPVAGLRAGLPDARDPSRPDPQSCRPSRAVPVVTFHGTGDATNPYAGGGTRYWQYGVDAALKRWVELNGCSPEPAVDRVMPRVTRIRHTGCRADATVELNLIDATAAEGGGHVWPGSPRRRGPEISASEHLWTFVSRYSLP